MNRLGTTHRHGTARRNRKQGATARFQRGVTLIEALITLLVVSVGLLGVAALQVVGVQEGASAFRQSKAIWLASDMADRMRANIDASGDPGGITKPYNGISVSAGSAPDGQVCGAGNVCSPTEMASLDSDRWRLGVMELPNGSGTVDEVGALPPPGRYRIRVMWDEVGAGAIGSQVGCPTAAPAVNQTCVELWVQP